MWRQFAKRESEAAFPYLPRAAHSETCASVAVLPKGRHTTDRGGQSDPASALASTPDGSTHPIGCKLSAARQVSMRLNDLPTELVGSTARGSYATGELPVLAAARIRACASGDHMFEPARWAVGRGVSYT